MAFQPPPGFLHNIAAMASLMQMNHHQAGAQFGLPPHPPPIPHPMGALMPMGGGLLPPTPVAGITVPPGVTSISAAPVRNIKTTEPFQGLPPPTSQPLLQTPTSGTMAQQEPPKRVPSGPSVTVFVGSITDRISDVLIKLILSKCGTVNVWKRVQGTNGKLQAFGFCDYADPESALRAIRILHDFQIGDKKLVVKADAKAQEKLNEYVKGKNPEASADDDVDEDTKKEDDRIRNEISTLLKENDNDADKDADQKRKGTTDGNKDELDDMELEEEKRAIVNREIDRFRDTYKEDEPDKSDIIRRELDKARSRDRRDRDNKSPQQESRLRDRNRRRDPGRERDRERERERDRKEHSNSRSRDDSRRGDDRYSSPADSEESIERRRLDRQLREKESSYQTRLRNWEAREERKSLELKRYLRQEKERKEEEAREAQKLKVFLEDYDDDRDDQKYYRSSILRQRLRERQKEIEDDERDRRAERKEWEELKRKLSEEGHPDPESEIAKRMNTAGGDKRSDERIKESERVGKQSTVRITSEDNSLSALSDTQTPKEEIHLNPFSLQMKNKQLNNNVVGESNTSPSDNNNRKRPVPDIFNNHEDDEALGQKKRRPPPALHDDDDAERKRQIEDLIKKLPTKREELFNYPFDWSIVDTPAMEKRIKPWVAKKIAIFIGEEEPALIEFICSKVAARSSAESILKEIVMVLEEEAEPFVLKLWRLLIYESKAKELGLSKW